MSEKIVVSVKKKKRGGYVARVKVNGEEYAACFSNNRNTALTEAVHYAGQIEFDEWGNW